MLIIASSSRPCSGFKNSTDNNSFPCPNSSIFITACLLYCINESIENFTVLARFPTKIRSFWSVNQNLECPNKEFGYLFRFTAKLNLTFVRNYRIHFLPNHSVDYSTFEKEFWLQSSFRLIFAWFGRHYEKSNISNFFIYLQDQT